MRSASTAGGTALLVLALLQPLHAAEPPADAGAVAPAAGRLRLVGTPSAAFEGRGPAGFRVSGHTDQLRVDDDGTRLRVTVVLATLTTGIGLRDRHMREKYLETERFPDATLALPWSGLTVPADGTTAEGATRAPLALHGQTHDVPVRWRVARHGSRLDVEGHADVDLRAFGITQPAYLGMTVQPDVVTTVVFAAERAP